MIVQKQNWAGIPLLEVYKEEMKTDVPVLIFLHGFMSAKEHNLHYAYNLVEQGIRVILPDAELHGERAQGYSELQLNAEFWRIVMQSVTEVGVLYEQLRARGYMGKVAIAGTSMGGIVISGCLRHYDFIEAAAILMGVVSYTDLAIHQVQQFEKQGVELGLTEEQKHSFMQALSAYNLKDEPTILQRVPVFFWHGANDIVVPYRMTRPFYEELEAIGQAERIRYVADKKAGHAVSRAGMLEMCQFIAQHLA